MKIIHIESGLGNQMLDYCEYLAMKHANPNEEVYIETMAYEFPEANEVINQWNGYELDKVFGIVAPNIRDLFSEEQWRKLLENIRETKWWDRNWNWPVCFTECLNKAGLNIKNIRGDFEAKGAEQMPSKKKKRAQTLKGRFFDTSFGAWLMRESRWIRRDEFTKIYKQKDKLFYNGGDSVISGQWLSIRYNDNGMEHIENDVLKSFVFPEFRDSKNSEMAGRLWDSESVAIHVRRGDMLTENGFCYKYGYFKRATKLIKNKVRKPVFVFFSDPESVKWCMNNLSVFGLSKNADLIETVDWNKGEESFRDMQLMAMCRHAIVTNSSFGWWGAFLNRNPNKITIVPKEYPMMIATHHC